MSGHERESVVWASVCGISATSNASSCERGDRQRDAVHRDRALLDAVAERVVAGLDVTRSPSPSRSIDRTRADPVDVALDDVAAHRVAGPKGRLDVDLRADHEPPSVERRQGFRNGMEAQTVALDRLGRETDAVDRDRAADVDAAARSPAPRSRAAHRRRRR